MKPRVRLKLLLAVGAAFLAFALVHVAADPFTPRYEITIYDGYPPAFWAALVGAVFLGQVAVFESAWAADARRYWKWGFALVLAANAVLLILPAIRYYIYAGADVLTFIGMTEQIRNLGVVPQSNYYPNVHLLTLALSYLTGLKVQFLVSLVPAVISLFYPVAVYALLRVWFEDSRKPLYVVPFAVPLVFTYENLMFSPSVFSFLLLPFVLYLLFRIYAGRSLTRLRLPFIVVIVAVVFYHPLTTLFFVGVFGLLALTLAVGRRFDDSYAAQERTTLVAASIAFVVFFAWYYSFPSIVGSTTIVVLSVLGLSQGTATADQLASVFFRTNPDVADVTMVGIYTYGMFAAIAGLSLAFVGYLAYRFARDREEFDVIEAFLALTFLAFTAGAVGAFFVDLPFGTTRLQRYARFAGTVLIGLGFYRLFRRANVRAVGRYLRPAAYVSFFVLAYLSVFMLYGSPLSNSVNVQVTESEVKGMEWVFENRDSDVLIDELGIQQYRFYTFLYETRDTPEGIGWMESDTAPPPHFEYDNASAVKRLDDSSTDRRYLVITELGRVRNPRFFPGYEDSWRHTPEDFERLENDPSVARVYDDGGLNAYLVREVGNQSSA